MVINLVEPVISLGSVSGSPGDQLEFVVSTDVVLAVWWMDVMVGWFPNRVEYVGLVDKVGSWSRKARRSLRVKAQTDNSVTVRVETVDSKNFRTIQPGEVFSVVVQALGATGTWATTLTGDLPPSTYKSKKHIVPSFVDSTFTIS